MISLLVATGSIFANLSRAKRRYDWSSLRSSTKFSFKNRHWTLNIGYRLNILNLCLYTFQAFTSIIGPNGSGKSNVIDSMLFVFGYRANKIRNKKVSGLIHNSEKFPNVQSATVEVHFCMIDGESISLIVYLFSVTYFMLF